ncbi:MAG: DUF6511 domain-containing protein [Proteobacteria bacterium]|nr:DUF6511 domain-containing protein [Pseudomonadota bacterium]
MRVCFICKREAGGFGFIPPPLHASDPRNHKMMKHFCSMRCQEIFSKNYKENNMIDLTKNEKEAIESTLKPVGEYVAEIGMDRPLSSYAREEVLCLIEVAVTAYFDFMQSKEAETAMLEVPC